MTGKNNGGPLATAPLVRAVLLCEDGEWHDFDVILHEVAKVIPPGRAMRRAEDNRRNCGGPDERIKGDTERIMATGKRSVARDFLRPPWFEIEPVGRVPRGTPRQIRLVKLPNRISFSKENIGPLHWAI